MTEQTKVPTPAEYWDMLNSHDWYYMMSDDNSVWRRGLSRSKELEAIANGHPELEALAKGFSEHYFSGKPWGTEQAPKPPRPEA